MAAKPKISLKIGGPNGANPMSPSVVTPITSAAPKIRLNTGASKPATPTDLVTKAVQKTKAGRAPKPSAKLTASKNGKRLKDESDDEEDLINAQSPAQHAQKKIKLSLGAPKTPTILKAKFKGKPPKRPLGEGYDSEASDREEDPVIEEEWVLRMMDGEDSRYVRQMIEERRVGIPNSQGGADIHIKFLQGEGRRAVLTVRGRYYAASMVDLPTIIEGMKSWDKKGWYKSADICQMLLVFKQVKDEKEALATELPKEIDPITHQYPHGLTPPMHYARKRRFRKRISRTAIEAVEDAVEKLLEADAKALSTRYEMTEPEGQSRQASFNSPGPYDDGDEFSENEEVDADGEVDEDSYFQQANGTQVGEELDDDLAAELEAAFDEDILDGGTPAANAIVSTPSGALNGHVSAEDDSGDESMEDDDDDEDADGEDEDGVDSDERARLAQIAGAREDITEMERSLASLQTQLQATQNPILKTRVINNIDKIKAELQLKRSAIGERDDDEGD